jgi:hypothetical protein
VHSFILDAFLKRSLKKSEENMFETCAKFFLAGMKAQ